MEDCSTSWTRLDESFEKPLRPQSFSEFVGQRELMQRLELTIRAAKQRNEPLGHCLFHGPPGLGKTTIAHILSKEMGGDLVAISAPTIEKAGDLAGILTSLKEGDVLFLDEIHRLSRNIEEYLYPAMEDFSLDLIIDSGPSARSVQVKIPPFTLVGATTRIGLLSSPMRSRFPFHHRLDYYCSEDLISIIKRAATLLNITISDCGAREIANRSRGTPRIAGNLLRWVRDFAQIHHHNKADENITKKALSMLSIDHLGLDEMDVKILSTLIEKHHGGPVGINTLAIAVSEEPHTLAEVHEPFLIMCGLLRRTPRGREVTKQAYQHLGLSSPHQNNSGETL